VRNTLYGIGYLDLRAQALSAESVIDTVRWTATDFLRNAYLKNRRFRSTTASRRRKRTTMTRPLRRPLPAARRAHK